MLRARGLAIAIVLLAAACTSHVEWEPEPIVARGFVGHCPVERDCFAEFSNAVEAHGIDCPGADGSIWGRDNGDFMQWRSTCRGTEQQWRNAESTILRMEAARVIEERIDRYFAILDPSDADENSAVVEALAAHGMHCWLPGSPVGSFVECVGNRHEWRFAEPTIARLTTDGVVRETSRPDE